MSKDREAKFFLHTLRRSDGLYLGKKRGQWVSNLNSARFYAERSYVEWAVSRLRGQGELSDSLTRVKIRAEWVAEEPIEYEELI